MQRDHAQRQLVVLAFFERFSWTVDELSEKLEVSVEIITQLVDEFEQDGWIEKVRSLSPNPMGPVVYRTTDAGKLHFEREFGATDKRDIPHRPEDSPSYT